MSDSAIYKEIADYLKSLIEKNKTIPNYILPSERLLAMKFKVSRNPVRHAYEQLLENSVVKKIHGKGYVINNVSETPIEKQSARINFIVPDLTTAFMQDILSGVEKFCDKSNIDLSIETSNLKPNKEKHLIQNAVTLNSDGIILFPIDGDNYNEELIRLSISKFPITVIDRYVRNLNFTYVGTDNFAAMEECVKFLHKKQFKKLVYITPRPSTASSVIERINGYNHGLIKYYGSSNAKNLLKISTNKISQIESVKSYLKLYPDTELLIFTGTQFAQIIEALSQLKLSAPKDIKLMIFDDELSITEKKLLKPYLIKQDGAGIGYTAAKLLYDQMYSSSKPTTKLFHIVIDDSYCN
ncbi:MAG: GntR family transcriptional regulator [Clostridia bacterium]|nr:GntR family transcriptional regulator [Clostridia bacterium]